MARACPYAVRRLKVGGTAGELRNATKPKLAQLNLSCNPFFTFEGGEPFLFYVVLLEVLRMARAAGLRAGIITNAYWATSFDDAVRWLEPIKEVCNLRVSDDDFHRTRLDDDRADVAYRAAKAVGSPASKICIEAPGSLKQGGEALKGKAVVAATFYLKAAQLNA